MCHSETHVLSSCKHTNGYVNRGTNTSQPPVATDMAYFWGMQHINRDVGGDGLKSKQCVCSPSSHPGAFRCRIHHREYKWGDWRRKRGNV